MTAALIIAESIRSPEIDRRVKWDLYRIARGALRYSLRSVSLRDKSWRLNWTGRHDSRARQYFMPYGWHLFEPVGVTNCARPIDGSRSRVVRAAAQVICRRELFSVREFAPATGGQIIPHFCGRKLGTMGETSRMRRFYISGSHLRPIRWICAVRDASNQR